jgi:hypothetical protein
MPEFLDGYIGAKIIRSPMNKGEEAHLLKALCCFKHKRARVRGYLNSLVIARLKMSGGNLVFYCAS